jgi:kumamolisin
MVPDVSANADPYTGYNVFVHGGQEVIGGTSAVAPLWAGLTALLNQQLGTPLGFINPRLYALAGSQAFQDITQGNNNGFSAGPGWDPCTGLGRPDGARLLAAISGQSATAPAG